MPQTKKKKKTAYQTQSNYFVFGAGGRKAIEKLKTKSGSKYYQRMLVDYQNYETSRKKALGTNPEDKVVPDGTLPELLYIHSGLTHFPRIREELNIRVDDKLKSAILKLNELQKQRENDFIANTNLPIEKVGNVYQLTSIDENLDLDNQFLNLSVEELFNKTFDNLPVRTGPKTFMKVLEDTLKKETAGLEKGKEEIAEIQEVLNSTSGGFNFRSLTKINSIASKVLKEKPKTDKELNNLLGTRVAGSLRSLFYGDVGEKWLGNFLAKSLPKNNVDFTGTKTDPTTGTFYKADVVLDIPIDQLDFSKIGFSMKNYSTSNDISLASGLSYDNLLKRLEEVEFDGLRIPTNKMKENNFIYHLLNEMFFKRDAKFVEGADSLSTEYFDFLVETMDLAAFKWLGTKLGITTNDKIQTDFLVVNTHGKDKKLILLPASVIVEEAIQTIGLNEVEKNNKVKYTLPRFSRKNFLVEKFERSRPNGGYTYGMVSVGSALGQKARQSATFSYKINAIKIFNKYKQ